MKNTLHLILLALLLISDIVLAKDGGSNTKAVYQASAVYDDYLINNPSATYYAFYFDRLDSVEPRKLAYFSCAGWEWNIKLIPDSPDYINNNQPLLQSPKEARVFSLRYFSKSSNCNLDLRLFYIKNLAGTSIVTLNSEDKSTISDNSAAVSSEQKDLHDNLRKIYSWYSDGNLALYHGKKTPFVFVFIHGLNMQSNYFYDEAVNTFNLGYNSFSISLDCQLESQKCITEPVSWRNYAESFINNIAAKYGEKVIIVGHSIGANIALQLAQKGLADGLILLEPAIKTSFFIRGSLSLESLVQNSKWYSENASFVFRAKLAQKFINMDNDLRSIKVRVPTLIYASYFDTVVSHKAIKQLADNNPEMIKLISNYNHNIYWAHVYRPFEEPQEMNRMLHFLKKKFGPL